MNKYLFGLFFLTLFLLAAKSAGAAGYGQYGQYGATCPSAYGEKCPDGKILIDKKIQLSSKGGNNFVDSLSINETRFKKGENVTFQLSLQNNSATDLRNVEVKDIFPEYLSFVSGPGSFDSNTRTLTFGIDSLKASEVKKFSVIGKVVEPTNVSNGTVCVVNQAIASTQNGDKVQDNASFCIEKHFAVLPAPKITQTPATGPEALVLFGLIPAGLSGLLLRRFKA